MERCFAFEHAPGETLAMREEFIAAIGANQEIFGLDLSDHAVERLADYYEIVQTHNPILHLVGPCSPAEFATRHVLESLTLLKHLPAGSRFVDIGPGAGFPSIPCLIARDDLTAVLIESKEKKSNFLSLVITNLFESARVEVINRQFEEVRDIDLSIVTCRALDRFIDKLPRLVKWSKRARLLLFGGDNLGEALRRMRLDLISEKMPLSEKRYLFVSKSKHKP